MTRKLQITKVQNDPRMEAVWTFRIWSLFRICVFVIGSLEQENASEDFLNYDAAPSATSPARSPSKTAFSVPRCREDAQEPGQRTSSNSKSATARSPSTGVGESHWCGGDPRRSVALLSLPGAARVSRGRPRGFVQQEFGIPAKEDKRRRRSPARRCSSSSSAKRSSIRATECWSSARIFRPTCPTSSAAAGRPVMAALRQTNGFRPERSAIERFLNDDPSPKAILFNSPHNPTGGVMTLEDMRGHRRPRARPRRGPSSATNRIATWSGAANTSHCWHSQE